MDGIAYPISERPFDNAPGLVRTYVVCDHRMCFCEIQPEKGKAALLASLKQTRGLQFRSQGR